MKTDEILNLFGSDLRVVNIGLEKFADPIRAKGIGVVQVDWKPPAGGDMQLVEDLERLTEKIGERIDEANRKVVDIILKAKPRLVGVGRAMDVIPGMKPDMILHSGPPVTWERMSGPTRGGVIGGLIYEGMAAGREEAEKLAASGRIRFEPCHHHDTVGPMAGIVTPAMPVCIFENRVFGNRSYCTFNEGLGKVLRYGAFSDEVIERLMWMSDVLAPVMAKVLELKGPIDMKLLLSQALQMGDEGHNRNRAGTSLFIREIASALVRIDAPKDDIARVLEFIHGNDHFFLNLSMGTAKCTVDAARGVEASSVIVAMARNGTDFGLRVSGLGDAWFTAPAPMVDGLYLPGFSAADAAPDIGDSVITETIGIGGFAMAAAPAIVKFVGGTPADAIATTRRMYDITISENDMYQIPALDFRGTPTGIDLLRVVRTGVLPAVNTGIAHKEPGIGMVGAGLVKPPLDCFIEAAKAFIEKYG
ncbi:MAG: DUF1116 domain-containing protein [Pseudomonadota bacterium]